MRGDLKIFIIVTISTLVSCKSDVIFDSFKPINQSEILSNTSKWGTGFMDSDSNMIFPLLKDTFHIYFDIIKSHDNALIFSTFNKDTIGNLQYKNNKVLFKARDKDILQKLFDFNANIGDSMLIENCGILTNDFLIIDSIRKLNNEIIQNIRVTDNSPFSKLRKIKIENITVSSKYGIKEMEIYVGWAAEKRIKIKNAP